MNPRACTLSIAFFCGNSGERQGFLLISPLASAGYTRLDARLKTALPVLVLQPQVLCRDVSRGTPVDHAAIADLLKQASAIEEVEEGVCPGKFIMCQCWSSRLRCGV
eukprot:1161440-Pelagomonas_calceolata.AAC.3